MKVHAGVRGISFVLSDDAVARTIERDGLLLDVAADGSVLALEIIDMKYARRGALEELMEEFDFTEFVREIEAMQMERRRKEIEASLNRKQKRRLDSLFDLFDFSHHGAAA